MQTDPPPRKLLDPVRDRIRVKHYSYRTEETYVQWIRQFILSHNKRHPSEMGGDEVIVKRLHQQDLARFMKAAFKRL